MIDLERVADWMTELRPVRTETGLCLRARSTRSACQVCTAVCPAGAITLERGPAVDPDLCTACGLCAAACPSGALRMETPSEAALLTAARRAGSGTAIFACATLAADLPAAVKNRLVVLPCIGGLTTEVLAGMLAAGPERLVLWQPAACAACPNGPASERLVNEAVVGVSELYPGAVVAGGSEALLADGEGAAANRQAPAPAPTGLDQKLAAEDRRAFLGAAVRNAGSLAGLLFGDWFVKPKPEPPKPAPIDVQGTVRRRQVLLQAVAAKPPAAGAHLPEHAVRAAETCSFCPACSRLCPAGALKVTTENGKAALWWQASRCTDCGLCREVCPTQSMAVGPRLSVEQFRSDKPEAIISGEAAVCACGKEYWQVPGGPTKCVACRLRSRE